MMFWIRIRNVKKIAKATMGEIWESHRKRGHVVKEFFDVRISIRENKRVGQYAKTLLHELLHLLFYAIVKVCNRHFTPQTEHDFIDAMEDSLLCNWYILKEKPKKKKIK